MLSLIHIIYLFVGALLSGCSAGRGHKGPVIHLDDATYEGSRLPSGVDQFLGVRYAQPPLGKLRFRAPRRPKTDYSTQDATQLKPICLGAGQVPSPSVAEDCLYANIFKPAEAKEGSNLPVWVYIQGGGYSFDANANYNGTGVIQASGNQIVFVNFNFRVGALGFLASEEVSRDGDLNIGLLDQRRLLYWIRSNISKFGGNPNHVVLHGTSAGAGSAAYHMTAYGGSDGDGLFVGAALQSLFIPAQMSVPEMEFQYQRLLKDTNCDALSCLRSLNIAELQAATDSAPYDGAIAPELKPLWYWLPVIDGDLVPDRLSKLFEQGAFIHIPVIIGHDADEGTFFAVDATEPFEMAAFFQSNYPNLRSEQLDRIVDTYPLQQSLPKHNAWFPSTAAAYGDCLFVCPGHEAATAIARMYDSSKVWAWRYNVEDPGWIEKGFGIPHTFILTAIFGVGNADVPAPSYSSSNAAVIPITMMYFISFVTTLDPNTYKAPGTPDWKPWGLGTGQRLSLQTQGSAMEPVPQDMLQKCEVWKDLSDGMQL